MNTELDYDLSHDQWDALKTLRKGASCNGHVKGYMVKDLASLGLIAIEGGVPVMTPMGRKVLVRGSCRLLDLAL
jgi:hypothetical protein